MHEVPCPLCGVRASKTERELAGYTLVRCVVCRFVYVNPQPTKEALEAIYSCRDGLSESAVYARMATQRTLGEYDRILRDLETRLPGKGRLLDFGCAAGLFSERALLRGWDIHANDLGVWIGEAVRARGVRNVHVGFLQEQRFPDCFFDVVHTSQVLEHLPTPLDELREIRRILRPGGLLYANVPNYRCLSIVLGRDDFELNTPPGHLNYFTSSTLARAMKRAGFAPVHMRSFGGLKWENLLGQPIVSDVADAVRSPAARAAATSWIAQLHRFRELPILRPAARLATGVGYRLAKLGINLEAFARCPTD